MTKHFLLREFSSPGTKMRNGKRVADYANRDPVPRKYYQNVLALMFALEVIRVQLGHKPIRIASGWRSQAFNRLSKGRATRSQHLVGKAADITVKGLRPAAVYWAIKDLIDEGEIPKGGLACYPGFVHYDIRGRNARWRQAPKRPRRKR